MDDEQLIECVRKYEFLYNVQHLKYMDSNRKNKAWKEISSQMKQPASACKQRWQCLRDSYRRALNKRKLKSGLAPTKIKMWKFENEMAFIVPFFNEKKNCDSVDLPSDDNGEDPDNDNQTSEINQTTFNDTAATDFVVVEGQKVESTVQNNDPSQVAAVLLTKFLENQNKLAPQRHTDELDRFFLCISDTVKKFPPYLQALAKNKVFSLVSDMELQQLAPVESVIKSD